MDVLQQKKLLPAIYLFFVISIIFTGFLNLLGVNATWAIMLEFSLVILLPGFVLTRIFKFVDQDFLGQLILIITAGFVYSFLICFLGILIGLNLFQVKTVFIILTTLLFLLSMVVDRNIFNSPIPKGRFFIRKFFSRNSALSIFLFIFLGLVLICLSRNGASFVGDPKYHLAIVRKAFEGQPLTAGNLSFIKGHLLLPYLFPVWQVFLALLARLSNASIFTIWSLIPSLFFPIMVLTWYWLFRKIMPTRGLTIIGVILVVIFTFGLDGYLFTRLPVPDTLNQLILFPLSLALAIRFIFASKNHPRELILLMILILLMAIIHFTQYVYFIFAITFFGLFYMIAKFREVDFARTLKRVGLILLLNVIILILFAVVAEITGKAFSNAFKTYFNLETQNYNFSFDSYGILSKIAYIFLPLALIFASRYKKLIFPFSLLLFVPLAYGIGFIKYWIIRLGSIVLFSRIYDSMAWTFVVWTVLLGFLILIFDRLLLRVNLRKKKIINFSITAMILVGILLELSFGSLTKAHQFFFSESTTEWFSHYRYLLILAILLLVSGVIIAIMRGSKKVEDFLTLSEYKNKYFVVVVLIFITLPLSMPVFQQSFEGLKNAKKSINWLHSPTYPSKAVGPGDLGGDRTIKFIKNNLPPKSIYYTNTGYLILPVMVDGYVPASGPAAYTSYDFLYHKNEDFPLLDKFKCIYAAKIEYLIFGHDPNRPNLYPVFDRYPEYFEKLYDDNVSIYKVNLEAIAPFVEDDVRLGLTPVCGY